AGAAGSACFLLFALRVPDDRLDPRWMPVERAVPLIGIALALALAASYGDLFGYHNELVNRSAISGGLVIDIAALSILIIRRRKETPENQQRLNWVIAGCLIG